MAYTKQNFKDGEVLTANNLSLMEDGIIDNINAINEVNKKVASFIDVTEFPTENISTDKLYRCIENKEAFYAITGTRKNIVKKEYLGTEYELVVEIKDVDTLPNYNEASGITDFTSSVVLYYNRSDNKVYGAINNLVLAVATSHSYGWYEPTVIIDNYAGVINDIMEAEDNKVYVVHEKKSITRIAYYMDKWYELSADSVEDYMSQLDKASYEKFKEHPDKDTNVRAYRYLNEDYDRVYVEGKGDAGMSGDYCLTPTVTSLPENPWLEPQEGQISHLPSIPVRHADGGIEVHTDDNSSAHMAVSKMYFTEKTEQYVRRKPEESSEVSKANVMSAHTWSPDDAPYEAFANTFSNLETIPNISDITSEDLVAIFSESNANNSIGVATIDDNRVIQCIHPTSAESHYRFIRQGSRDELVFSTDIKIAPMAGKTNNRGFTLLAKNAVDAPTNTSLWGGSNLTVEYPKGGAGYTLTYLGQTIPFTDFVGDWINLRIEIDSLSKDATSRLYINNKLKISGEITVSLTSIKAYDFMIYNWNNSNSGFNGDIYLDNMYFGDIPPAIRYSGYDTLTPVAYDYEDESIANLNMDTLVLRKPDGTMLTKKEIPASADGRTVASKHYVDNSVSMATLRITYDELKQLRDNNLLTEGRFYRITDYVCTTTQADTRAADNKFDIIVQALSTNTLSETAFADYHMAPTLKSSVIDSNKALVEGSVIPAYYEFIDYGDSKNSNNGLVTEYLQKDVFIAYDYLENNDGALVPILYKTDSSGVGQDGDPEFADPDYQDAFYYVGTEIIDSTTYDKWRKIDNGSDDLTWDSTGKVYLYTNVIVENTRHLANCNIPAWELKYSLDNDTSRFAWADATNGRGVIYYMEDEWNNECPYDFKNIQFRYYSLSKWGYTFDSTNIAESNDYSLSRQVCNNHIGEYRRDDRGLILNKIGIINYNGVIQNVHIGNGCHDIILSSKGATVRNVTIGSDIKNRQISTPNDSAPIIYRAPNTLEIILD